MDEGHRSDQCAVAWLVMRQVHTHISRLLEIELRDHYGLTQSEFDTLLALYLPDTSPRPISAICPSVDLSQPALSRLLSRLEDRGWITRSRTELDARQILIGLTDSGRAHTARAITAQTNIIATSLNTRISESDQQVLVEILTRVTPHPSVLPATPAPADQTTGHPQTPRS